MDEKMMRGLFQFEQGARLSLDSTPGCNNCITQIEATDTDAAMIGLGILTIRLAEELQVPAEKVLAALAVTIMKIGEKISETA